MPKRKEIDHGINYLSVETTKDILSKPDISTPNGRRDMVLLCLLYDTGARVSELINLKVRDIRFDNPAKVRLHGKGNKIRDVPILPKTQKMLREYLLEQRMFEPHKIDAPVFFNHMGQKLTRSGVAYILKKYTDGCVSEGEFNISPHLLRHTKAMHLLQAGVNIVYIKDLLGHVDIKTTEVYARANLDMKKEALEAVDDISPDIVPIWQHDADLLNWLDTLSKVK